MNEVPQRQTLTVEETAKVLGLGRNTAYALVRSGEIPSLRLGKRILIPAIAIQRKLEGDK
jgi:excisionase family DNA binding protein